MSEPAQASRRSEFEELLEPVLDRAWGLALRLTREKADADDLVQEAALLAYKGFGTFRRGTNFGAWFSRILTNAFLSSKRRRRVEDAAVALDDTPGGYLQRQAHELVASGTGDRSSDVLRSVLGRIETEHVSEAIDSLPDEFRIPAALYFFEDLSYQDIADVLGIPVGTVRSRLHRGRALLQRRLWALAVDHGLVPARSTK